MNTIPAKAQLTPVAKARVEAVSWPFSGAGHRKRARSATQSRSPEPGAKGGAPSVPKLASARATNWAAPAV